MIWYQAGFDPESPYPNRWVVLRFDRDSGGTIHVNVHRRCATQHEAEGHARKALKAHGG